MGQPFFGEIRMFGGNFAPADWAFCDGQVLDIALYDTLFNVIGTTYGGDGVNTFALPDLRGRIPIHQGTSYVIGQSAGEESVTLTAQHIPSHTHALQASSAAGTSSSPTGNVWAATTQNLYSAGAPATNMAANALASAGGNQPHGNLMPYLTVSFIIALYGIYPSPS